MLSFIGIPVSPHVTTCAMIDNLFAMSRSSRQGCFTSFIALSGYQSIFRTIPQRLVFVEDHEIVNLLARWSCELERSCHRFPIFGNDASTGNHYFPCLLLRKG